MKQYSVPSSQYLVKLKPNSRLCLPSLLLQNCGHLYLSVNNRLGRLIDQVSDSKRVICKYPETKELCLFLFCSLCIRRRFYKKVAWEMKIVETLFLVDRFWFLEDQSRGVRFWNSHPCTKNAPEWGTRHYSCFQL